MHKLKPLLSLKIPRFVGNVNVSRQCEVLVFYDASMKAYATVIYLCIEKRIPVLILCFQRCDWFVRGLAKKRLKKDSMLPQL